MGDPNKGTNAAEEAAAAVDQGDGVATGVEGVADDTNAAAQVDATQDEANEAESDEEVQAEADEATEAANDEPGESNETSTDDPDSETGTESEAGV